MDLSVVGLVRIVSGGQTGADQGGLRAAKTLGLQTGGWAPADFRTEDGPAYFLRYEYGLEQHLSDHDYAPRTEANVKLADATVIFGRRSRGSNLTERLCQLHGKPLLWISGKSTEIHRFRLWLARHEVQTLNVAGNRESVTPGIGAAVEAFLLAALRLK